MQTFDGLAADLLRGGRGGQLRALDASRDGEKLAGMVDASAMLIAAYNGTPGGTRATLLYAIRAGLEVVQLPMEA